MLVKLAFKNVGKNFRDYAVYFLTLVLGVSVFYMFNSIYAQQEIMSVTEAANQAMEAVRAVLSYLSLFVAVILGFLIIYANNFFVKRRKKELGVYLTLGMTKGKVSLILVLETSLMALLALFVGLAVGIFGSQFMSVFTAKLFEADLKSYRFVFSLDAAINSIICFAIIFFVVVLFNTAAVSRFKLIDLLYGGRKNEELRIKNVWISVILFVVSLLCLAAAYGIILKNGIININSFFTASICLGIIGTLLFFLSLSGFLIRLVQGNQKLYYKDLNLFVLRQMTSRINTNFVSVSVVCLVLFLVISIFSSGYSMQNVLSKDMTSSVKFDFSIIQFPDENDTKDIYGNLPGKIQSSQAIREYAEYETGSILQEDSRFGDYDLDFSSLSFDIEERPLYFMRLSEYNKVRKLQGISPVALSKNQYLIVCDRDNYRTIAIQFLEKKLPVTVEGKDFFPVDTIETTTLNNAGYSNLTFILQDEFLQKLSAKERILNIQCTNEKAARDLQEALKSYRSSVKSGRAFEYFVSRQDMYTSSYASKAMISYLAIYLGIVFMITCAATLAIQQLSEAEDNKERYALLKKLGAERNMLNRALFVQIFFYFFLPLCLAVIHSVVGLTAANAVIQLLGKVDITLSVSLTAVFVVMVYGAYFWLTYIGSKNIINKK